MSYKVKSMTNPNTTFVIGHRNPDMDSIASAIGYAWLLNQRQDGGYTAARAGEINAQTAFVLDHFHVDAPQIMVDVRLRVRDIVELTPALRGEPTILQICQHFATTRRSVPLLDDDERPRGLLSAIGLFGYLVNPIVEQQINKLQHALSQSAEALFDEETVVLRDSDYLSDVIQRVRHVEPDDYLVVDASGRYMGLCRTSGMLTAPRQKLILVDHNEASQAVLGIEEAEVVEVLDHHRVDTIETLMPIRFHVEPVGSCSTLVLEQAKMHQLIPPDDIAGLLLCGILSDTLIFQSPTTTERDRQAAYQLAEIAQLPGDLKASMQTLGYEMLVAGAGLGTRSAEDTVHSDLKFYTSNGHKLAIAQVEVTSFEGLDSHLPDLQAALRKLLTDEELTVALLMVTDILRSDSRILVAGDTQVIAHLPFPQLADGTLTAPGVVSRKKQLAPLVLTSLQ
jgi:manganese-dependent inorganic pyrophosphatase